MKLLALTAALFMIALVTSVGTARAGDASDICSFSYEGIKGGTDVNTFISTVEALGFSREGRRTNPNFFKQNKTYRYHVHKSIAGPKNVSITKTLLTPTNADWKDTPFYSDIQAIKDKYCATANSAPESRCNETDKTFNLSLTYRRTPPLANCNLVVSYGNGEFSLLFGY